MVSVEEALAAAGEAGRGSTLRAQSATLDEIDRMRADVIGAQIDTSIFRVFDGEPFVFDLPVAFHGSLVGTPGAVNEVKRRYEEGGWTVVVLPQLDGDRVVAFKLVMTPAQIKRLAAKKTIAKKLMPVSALKISDSAPMRQRLLVRFPTRARPLKAIEVLQKYREMAGCAIAIEVVVDEDDEATLRADVLQRFAALGCVVTVGRHGSKIEACNGGRLRDWDVIMLASDDMVPVVQGYAVRVLEAMEEHWPHLDGAIFFDDGFQHSNLCTLPIIGRRLHDQFGYVYDPKYKSLFCDREQTDLLLAMGRLVYVDEKIIEHHHHVWGRAEKDALYERNDALESEDRRTFEWRKTSQLPSAQWAFNSPPLQLSILICTVPKRRALLERLLGDLWRQILRVGVADPREVEVLVDDREGVTIGEKRQALLERAKGHYVAHVDDDDGVAHDYVKRILAALRFNPGVDCLSLVGAITTNGGEPETFRHSLSHERWETVVVDGKKEYLRSPNHLNAVKRELALRVGFVSKNFGEDHDFSSRLQPLLKSEASTGSSPLYYYWYVGNK